MLCPVDVERALQLSDLALAEPPDRRGEEARDLGAEARRDLEAFASKKSPARIALRFPHRAFTLSTVRRVTASSITSSW